MNKKVFGLVTLLALSMTGCYIKEEFEEHEQEEAKEEKQDQKSCASGTFSTGSTDDLMIAKVSKPICDPECIAVKNIADMCGAISEPVTKNSGLILSGDFIFWETRQDGMGFGLTSTSQTLTLPHSLSVTQHELDTQWKPGFRVDIGYIFGQHDSWDTMVEWTHFTPTEKTRFEKSGVKLIPTWGGGILGESATSAEVTRKIRYNIGDIELGRHYFTGKALSVRPHAGLRFAQIKQHYQADYSGAHFNLANKDEETSFEANNNFKGIGLRSGAHGTWHFYKNVGLLAKVSGSLLVGSFDIEQTWNGFQDQTTPPTPIPTVSNYSENLKRVRANFETQLGLTLTHSFKNGNWVRLFFGYDSVHWFDQNMLVNNAFTGDTTQTLQAPVRRAGNLGTHGGTAKIEVKF